MISYSPNGMTVAKVQGRDDLPKEFPGLFRGQTALLNKIIKELTTTDMLQDKIPGSAIKEKSE